MDQCCCLTGGLTGDVLHEDEPAQDADEDGHHGAAGHVERVARVGLQRTPLQHAVLVAEVRGVRPAAGLSTFRQAARDSSWICCKVRLIQTRRAGDCLVAGRTQHPLPSL